MFRTLLPPGSSPNRAETQVCLTLIVEPIVRPPAAQQRITPSQQSVERPEGRSPPFGHDVALADYLAQPGGQGGGGRRGTRREALFAHHTDTDTLIHPHGQPRLQAHRLAKALKFTVAELVEYYGSQ